MSDVLSETSIAPWIDLGSTYQKSERYAHALSFGKTYLFYEIVSGRNGQIIGIIGTIDLSSVSKTVRRQCLRALDYPANSGVEVLLTALVCSGIGDISHRIIAYNWMAVEGAVWKQAQLILRRNKRAA